MEENSFFFLLANEVSLLRTSLRVTCSSVSQQMMEPEVRDGGMGLGVNERPLIGLHFGLVME